MRKKKEIDRNKNFWLKPTFWKKPNIKLDQLLHGSIGFRTWPSLNTIRKKGESLTV